MRKRLAPPVNRPTKLALQVVQSGGLDELLVRLSKLKGVQHLASVFWDDRDVNARREVARSYLGMLTEAGVCLRGKRILEVGSGSSVGAGFFLVNQGFEHWIASDLSRNPCESQRLARREVRVAAAIARELGVPLRRFLASDSPLVYAPPFEFRSLDISKHAPDLDNECDLVVSDAVLEHVPSDRLDASIRNLSRYLRPGGCAVHTIDLRDHISLASPFHFYEYSRARWEKLVGDSIFYTNRWRFVDFVRAFQAEGLVVRHTQTSTESLPRKIHPELLQQYSAGELGVATGQILLEKPQCRVSHVES